MSLISDGVISWTPEYEAKYQAWRSELERLEQAHRDPMIDLPLEATSKSGPRKKAWNDPLENTWIDATFAVSIAILSVAALLLAGSMFVVVILKVSLP